MKEVRRHVPTEVQTLYEGERVKVHDVTYPGKDGNPVTYTMVTTNPYVSALVYAILPEVGIMVIFQRAFRQAAGRMYDPTEGTIGAEDALSAIRREVAEELGINPWQIRDWQFLGYAFQQTDRGLAAIPEVNKPLEPKTAKMYLVRMYAEQFNAWLDQKPSQHLDDEENIAVIIMTLDSALEEVMAEAKRTGCSPVLLLMLLELKHRERGLICSPNL